MIILESFIKMFINKIKRYKMTEQQIINEFKGLDVDSNFISRKIGEFCQRYPKQFIAVKDDKLIVETKRISQTLLEKINRLKEKFYVNITSGRSLIYLNRIYGQILWHRASLQAENGVFTLINGEVLQHDKLTFQELDRVEEIRREIRTLARGN